MRQLLCCFLPSAFILVVSISASQALAEMTIELLALSGEPAPGLSGVAYSGSPPLWARASRDGRFTWHSTLSNGQEAIWVNDKQGTRILAIAGEGQVYPGIFEQPSGFINSNGNVPLIMVPGVDDTSFSPQEVIVTDGVNQQVVLRSGEQAPGLAPGIAFGSSSVGVLITDSDVLLQRRVLSGVGINFENDNSWWVGPPDDIRLLIREGDQAPGLEGELIGSLTGSGARINDIGYAVVADRLKDSVTGDGNAVWAGTPGDLELIAYRGLPAPKTNGLVFGLPGSNAVTEANEIVLISNFDDPNTGLSAGSGLYYGPRDDLQLIIPPNTSLPLIDDFELQITGLSINRTGSAVMFANLPDEGGDLQRAILKVDLEDVTQTTAIIAVGDEAPGTEGSFVTFGTPHINDRGDILFAGVLTGFDGPFRGHGVWFKPVDGPLKLVALEGQEIEIKTSSGLVTRTSDRAFIATALTDEGSVGIGFRFTDRSIGLFAARHLIVPEPSSLILAVGLIGVVGYLRLRIVASEYRQGKQ